MRLNIVVVAAFAGSIAANVFAQDWVEFVSREDRFTVTFPAQPTVTQTTYKSQFGADLPARVYDTRRDGDPRAAELAARAERRRARRATRGARTTRTERDA